MHLSLLLPPLAASFSLALMSFLAAVILRTDKRSYAWPVKTALFTFGLFSIQFICLEVHR